MTPFAVVDPEDIPRETFTTCDVTVRELTEALGCTEVRSTSNRAR
jgi:hypothetical protein